MKRLNAVMWARCLSLVLLSVLFSAGFAAAADAEPFKFTKVDLDLLDKTNQADKEFERKALIYDDPEANAYIKRIGMKVVPEGAVENVTWNFRVLRDPIPNAFAFPNGSIYIHIGLLAVVRNEAQLAAILGHEVTHVVNRHGYLENRAYRKKMATVNILAAAGGVGGGFGGVAGVAISGVLGTLVPSVMVATIYGYSRELEREADTYGLQAMVRNNYPPLQMAAVFEILKFGYEVPLEKEARGLYVDHPRLDDRIKYVNEMAETLKLSGEPVVRAKEYGVEMELVMRHDVALEILNERARTALAVARRLKEMDPGSSENAFLLGEAYRALGGRTPEPRPEELTDSAKNATRKQLGKMTFREYDASLRATPEGKAAWLENVKAAEEAYNHALMLDAKHVQAVRGLATLYDEDGRTTEALAGYRQYLQLAPAAMDAYRIKRRTEELEKVAAATSPSGTNHN